MLRPYKGQLPEIDPNTYISDDAIIIGDVTISKDVSVWPTVVIRGDIEPITIGEGTNIQDGSVVHGATGFPVYMGKFITVGHKAIVHACTVEDYCMIGMGAIVLDGAVIGHHSIVGSNALVTKGTVIPPYSMVLGSPAKVVRSLKEEEAVGLEIHAKKYIELSKDYREETHE